MGIKRRKVIKNHFRTYKVGRNQDKTDITVSDGTISRTHCEINVLIDEKSGNPEVFITDLQSANGTFIDEKEIPPNRKCLLNFSSKLTLGDCKLYLVLEIKKSTRQITKAENPLERQKDGRNNYLNISKHSRDRRDSSKYNKNLKHSLKEHSLSRSSRSHSSKNLRRSKDLKYHRHRDSRRSREKRLDNHSKTDRDRIKNKKSRSRSKSYSFQNQTNHGNGKILNNRNDRNKSEEREKEIKKESSIPEEDYILFKEFLLLRSSVKDGQIDIYKNLLDQEKRISDRLSN